jgi:hypothetical protein
VMAPLPNRSSAPLRRTVWLVTSHLNSCSALTMAVLPTPSTYCPLLVHCFNHNFMQRFISVFLYRARVTALCVDNVLHWH